MWSGWHSLHRMRGMQCVRREHHIEVTLGKFFMIPWTMICLWYIISQFTILVLRNLAYRIVVVTFYLSIALSSMHLYQTSQNYNDLLRESLWLCGWYRHYSYIPVVHSWVHFMKQVITNVVKINPDIADTVLVRSRRGKNQPFSPLNWDNAHVTHFQDPCCFVLVPKPCCSVDCSLVPNPHS